MKTSGSFVQPWPAEVPSELWRRRTHAYVFVRTAKDGHFEAFLASAESVADAVIRNLGWDEKRGKKRFPVWCLPGSPAGRDTVGVEALRAAWTNWMPSVV